MKEYFNLLITFWFHGSFFSSYTINIRIPHMFLNVLSLLIFSWKHFFIIHYFQKFNFKKNARSLFIIQTYVLIIKKCFLLSSGIIPKSIISLAYLYINCICRNWLSNSHLNGNHKSLLPRNMTCMLLTFFATHYLFLHVTHIVQYHSHNPYWLEHTGTSSISFKRSYCTPP